MCRAISLIQPMPPRCAGGKFTFAFRSYFQILRGKTVAGKAITVFLNIIFLTITETVRIGLQ